MDVPGPIWIVLLRHYQEGRLSGGTGADSRYSVTPPLLSYSHTVYFLDVFGPTAFGLLSIRVQDGPVARHRGSRRPRRGRRTVIRASGRENWLDALALTRADCDTRASGVSRRCHRGEFLRTRLVHVGYAGLHDDGPESVALAWAAELTTSGATSGVGSRSTPSGRVGRATPSQSGARRTCSARGTYRHTGIRRRARGRRADSTSR